MEQVRARLRAKEQANPGCERFGAIRHRYRLGPVLAEAEVAAFEDQHGVSLPESYRSFLIRVGSEGAGPCYGLFRLDGADMRAMDREERETPSFLATPFPHTAAWNPNSGSPAEGWLDDNAYFDPAWVTGSLVIAEYGCGAFYRLVVTGTARGQVWFDDRASDGGLMPEADFREWYLNWLDGPDR